jgi:arginine/ornithine N-succinyltransferase beta subunit
VHLFCYSRPLFIHGIVDEFVIASIRDEQGVSAMWNSIGSWFFIMGLIIGPFSVGIIFEEKLQKANRELGSRLLRRY